MIASYWLLFLVTHLAYAKAMCVCNALSQSIAGAHVACVAMLFQP